MHQVTGQEGAAEVVREGTTEGLGGARRQTQQARPFLAVHNPGQGHGSAVHQRRRVEAPGELQGGAQIGQTAVARAKHLAALEEREHLVLGRRRVLRFREDNLCRLEGVVGVALQEREASSDKLPAHADAPALEDERVVDDRARRRDEPLRLAEVAGVKAELGKAHPRVGQGLAEAGTLGQGGALQV